MWPPLLWLLSRPLDRHGPPCRCQAVIIEIAVTVASVMVVGSAVTSATAAITAIAVTAVTVDVVEAVARLNLRR